MTVRTVAVESWCAVVQLQHNHRRGVEKTEREGGKYMEVRRSAENYWTRDGEIVWRSETENTIHISGITEWLAITRKARSPTSRSLPNLLHIFLVFSSTTCWAWMFWELNIRYCAICPLLRLRLSSEVRLGTSIASQYHDKIIFIFWESYEHIHLALCRALVLFLGPSSSHTFILC